MKILVTGALGHIGSHFIREIPHNFDNVEILLLDNLSTNRYASLFNLPDNASFKFFEGDVRDKNLLKNIVSGVDVIVHLAAITDAAGTADNPELVFNNNFKATLTLAEIALEHNIPVLFPSTTSVYGSQQNLVDENCGIDDLKPQSPYAETKMKEESLLKQYKNNGLKFIICRLGTIYGPSIGMRFHTAVNKFCWQAVMGSKLSVWKTAYLQKRPYLHIKDASQVMCSIIKKNLFDGDIYNILSGNYTVKQVVDAIRQFYPRLECEMVDSKIMNQLSYEVSNKKFIDLGFKFSGVLGNGIAETIKLLQQSNSKIIEVAI